MTDDKEELRTLEERRQKYLSIVNDSRRKRFDRNMAQGDLEAVDVKIAELKKKIESDDEEIGPMF